MKLILVTLLLFISSFSAASDIDLEANMKNMGLAYKNSVRANDLATFNTAIDEFIELLETAKTADFKQHKTASLEGLNKVINQAKQAKQLASTHGLEAAKAPLKSIDELRKKYHELHEPPGFWELLFGK
ncbi:cytochrome b562 [Pseudoalteromonas shioyasakiensis]|uniref:cytochrome b562 n=1 Tax=Pseudoalteromonas shioyasakiensis TaxID=1190813 RepID=UPI0021182973|nr:cytochrome b562 [Pseudoalteromonas shioyasakiensis]MCQ8880422.1 cytochrome b562 [Pseudoalteromonas shioyasakiensis]